jgi:Na+/proline symporter
VAGPSETDTRSESDGAPAEGGAQADATDPKAAFLDALNVRRNGTIGVLTGLLFGIVVYVGFVALPASTTFPRSLYLPLIVVVAFGIAVVVAIGLTAIVAWRRVRDLPEG